MPNRAWIFSLPMVDASWLLEFALITLSWVILRHSGSLKTLLKPRALLETALLFLILTFVTFFSNVVIGGGNYFLLLRLVAQGVITAAYMFHFSAYRRKTKLLLWLAMMTASMSIYHLSGQCSLLLDNLNAPGPVQGAARVVIHLALIGVALWLRRLRFDDFLSVPASGLWMIGADTVCVLLLYVTETVSYTERSVWLTLTLLVAYVGMLTMVLAAVSALYALCREQQAIIDLQAEKQRFLSEQEQTRMTEAMLHNLRSIRHDLKNQYAYMQILLSEKRYTELEDYFSELLSALPAPLNLVDCGNHTLNTVLNMEFSKLRADGIPFQHKLVVPPALPFKNEDVCAILSNLIDNAAEECRRMKEKGMEQPDILVEIHPHQSYLFIQCSNSTDRTALTRKKGGLQTTKGDAELHGYGTQIIMKLAEKYNGYANYNLEDGRFVAQVMLDMEA